MSLLQLNFIKFKRYGIISLITVVYAFWFYRPIFSTFGYGRKKVIVEKIIFL